MSQYRPIVDIIRDVVTCMASELPCYYEHGHRMEIINILSQKSANVNLKFEKYPLIALFQDFKEEVTLSGRDVSLNIAIITDTRPEWMASERQVETFDKVLYPLWDLFFKYLQRSVHVDQNGFTYDKYDRMYWGKQAADGTESNIFNDTIDAIEIENLKLHIVEKC